jgi:CheY-like chemotaxis protein
VSKKLLLADDSVTIQKVVNLTFADEGIEVLTAGDGDTALKMLFEHKPDIVIADVNMPGPNGYQICERIKTDARLKNIPVILLVGTFEPFNEEEAKRVGADDFLTKPFQSIRHLMNKVSTLLKSHDTSVTEETTTREFDYRSLEAEDYQIAEVEDVTIHEEPVVSYAEVTSEAKPYDEKTEKELAITQPLSHEDIKEIAEQKSSEEASLSEEQSFYLEEASIELSSSMQDKSSTEIGLQRVEDDVRARFQEKSAEFQEKSEEEKIEVRFEVSPYIGEVAESESEKGVAEDKSKAEEFKESDLEQKAETIQEKETTVESSAGTVEAEALVSAETAIAEPAEELSLDIQASVEQQSQVKSSQAEDSILETEDSVLKTHTVAESEGLEASPATEFSFSATESAVSDSFVEEKASEDASSVSEVVEHQTIGEIAEQQEIPEVGTTQEQAKTMLGESVIQGFSVEGSEKTSFGITKPDVIPLLDLEEDEILELPTVDLPIEASNQEKAEQVRLTEKTPAEEQKISAEQKEAVVTEKYVVSLPPEVIEAIAQKIVEKLSERAVKEIAWEVVPQQAELIIRKMVEERFKK